MRHHSEDSSTMGEILAALSYALDLVEGQPRGHAARTALITNRMVELLDLDLEERRDAFYVCLLKDSGCSDNSARVHKLFGGDDLLAKRTVKLVDWSNPIESVKYAISSLEPGGTIVQKLRKIPGLLGPPNLVMDRLTDARCTRASAIARQLGFSRRVGEALSSLDEHWDGHGSPRHTRGDKIPLLSRIVGLAQTMEVFASTFGVQEAVAMVKKRKGKWFDPRVASVAIRLGEDEMLWKAHHAHLCDPGAQLPIDFDDEVTPADIDQICQAFASIIDAKSSFTAEHSTRVAGYSVELAQYFGFSHERLTVLRRAALLHDVGKLGVSNMILDKPDKLTDAEFEMVKLHPRFSHEILSRIKGFERIAEIASAHHEKLNGRGYWKGLTGEFLDLEMRILAVADIFDALTAKRPYREALPIEKVFAILDKDSGEALDAPCIEAMRELKFGREAIAA